MRLGRVIVAITGTQLAYGTLKLFDLLWCILGSDLAIKTLFYKSKLLSVVKAFLERTLIFGLSSLTSLS